MTAKTLALIADIAEGSQTVNSLPHIAKLARAALAAMPGRIVDTTKLDAGQLVQRIMRIIDHATGPSSSAKLAEEIAAGILDLPPDYWHSPDKVENQ